MGAVASWTPVWPRNPPSLRGDPDVTPEQITLAGVLVAIGVAGAAGKWVFGWVYTAMVKDRDFWRDKALSSTGLAEIATDEAEKSNGAKP